MPLKFWKSTPAKKITSEQAALDRRFLAELEALPPEERQDRIAQREQYLQFASRQQLIDVEESAEHELYD